MMPLHPLGILIVDDNESDFRSTRDLFERSPEAPFAFKWAPSYEAGLAAVVTGTADVCLVDYDLEGRSGLDLVREAHHHGARTPMILLKGHESRSFEEETRLAGAEDCISKWQLTPALLERSVRYAIESSRLRTYARESSRLAALGRLMSGVAHDFNNMLTAIVCEAEHLKEALPDDDPRHLGAREIIGASMRAADLTRQLLAFGRERAFHPRTVDLNTLVKGVERMLRQLAGANVDLVTVLRDDAGFIIADASQTEQVVINLVMNARDAMPDGGRLSIETRNVIVQRDAVRDAVRPGAYVVLSVTDEGTGMEDSVRAHIFEPFFSTKESDKGSGLGLSTVRDFVELSGGVIVVHTELGRGSTFELYLPCAA